MGEKRVRMIVDGRVQGVGFRYSAYHEAQRLGLSGYVANLPDGSLESAAQGPSEALEAYIEFMRRGPARARVDRFLLVDEPSEDGLGDFRILR